jgi:hypothetical protein
MESLSKKNNAYVEKKNLSFMREKSTHPDICRFAEFYLPQERTLHDAGRQMFCTPVFADCFIRENRNVAIIYYLRKARSKTKLEKEGFCVRAKDVLQRFISSLFLINFLANSIELYFPNS